MKNKGTISQTRRQFSFWLSILFHVLIILSLFTLYTAQQVPPQQQQKLPNYFVPAYTYTGSIKPAAATPKTAAATPKESLQANKPSDAPDAPPAPEKQELALKPVKPPASTAKRATHRQPSLIAASFNMLQQDQITAMNEPVEEDPIYLVGDDSQPADPLIKMLGHALSAHFRYPETAGRLGIRGKVIVEMVLHPNGNITNVHIVRSSSNQDLDSAALYAANSAPTIEGAERFIDKPKHFVVGFVYN